MQKILLVGCGDVARRILPLLLPRYRVLALLRQTELLADWRQAGARPILADLDDAHSLRRITGQAEHILHFAPPPSQGRRDTRTRHLLAALSRGKSLPRSLIYISTTGVYGDCGGAWIDETRAIKPQSPRAQRRVDAEQQFRDWGLRNGVRIVILRAPGIYGEDRLPLERLHKGMPALNAEEDGYSNHIHADDLAAACLAALRHGQANRAVNVVDDSDLRMGEYFDRVADAFALPRPPRISRVEAERSLPPMLWSFMRESRRIGNRRLKEELHYRLRYPTVDDVLRSALQQKEAAC